MSIGKRIKKIRNSLGLTQDKLASDANISRSYLADVENDRYNPSFDTLESIAEALNVSVDRLTGEAASSIIEERLKETGITLEDVANKTNVPLEWLQNLDSITPDHGDELGYKWITRVARVLGLPGSGLRAALARQEPPVYDGPTSSVEENFANVDFDDETSTFTNSTEVEDLLETLHKRPEMRTLFSVTKNATKEDIEKAVKIIEALKED